MSNVFPEEEYDLQLKLAKYLFPNAKLFPKWNVLGYNLDLINNNEVVHFNYKNHITHMIIEANINIEGGGFNSEKSLEDYIICKFIESKEV